MQECKVSSFFQDLSHDIQQLHRYAAVAKLFINFNTVQHCHRLHRLNGCLAQQDKFCCHFETVCKMACFKYLNTAVLSKNAHFVA